MNDSYQMQWTVELDSRNYRKQNSMMYIIQSKKSSKWFKHKDLKLIYKITNIFERNYSVYQKLKYGVMIVKSFG